MDEIKDKEKEQDVILEENPIRRHESMEAGELELRKAFEEVTRKNVSIVIDYSKDTRRLVRELGDQVKNLQNTILSKTSELNLLKTQVAMLQAQMYQKGTN